MSWSCGLQKGKYAFIVATHTDRAHIHNHFKCNSTLIDGAWKSKGFKRLGLALHKMSDMICREKGLFVIEPRPKSEMARRTDYLKRNGLRNRVSEDRNLRLIAHMILLIGEALCA